MLVTTRTRIYAKSHEITKPTRLDLIESLPRLYAFHFKSSRLEKSDRVLEGHIEVVHACRSLHLQLNCDPCFTLGTIYDQWGPEIIQILASLFSPIFALQFDFVNHLTFLFLNYTFI